MTGWRFGKITQAWLRVTPIAAPTETGPVDVAWVEPWTDRGKQHTVSMHAGGTVWRAACQHIVTW